MGQILVMSFKSGYSIYDWDVLQDGYSTSGFIYQIVAQEFGESSISQFCSDMALPPLAQFSTWWNLCPIECM